MLEGTFVSINGKAKPFTQLLKDAGIECKGCKSTTRATKAPFRICECPPDVRGEILTAEDRVSHMQRKHASFVCALCPKKLPKLNKIVNHYSEYHDINLTKYKCPIYCSKDFQDWIKVNRHIARKHVKDMVPMNCPEAGCQEIFTKLEQLKAHFARAHETWLGTASRIEVITEIKQLLNFNENFAKSFAYFMDQGGPNRPRNLKQLDHFDKGKATLVAMHAQTVFGFVCIDLRRGKVG